MRPATVLHESRFRREWLAAAVLAGATFAAFVPALRCEFVNFDDPQYVTKNPHVSTGLAAANVRWAFTTFENANWHPLTWLCLQLDASLWGLKPTGYHLTNVLLHAANAAVLFLALQALTGCFWRSAAVALLFAVHPLRAESVAWVTERKDVLSALFGFLALWAYAAYARAPSVPRYLAVGVALAFSLMAKPMFVTLPCLLLVLDWWPLGRARAPRPAGPPLSSGRPGPSGPGRATAVKDRPAPGRAAGTLLLETAPAERPAPAPAPASRVAALLGLVAEKLPLFALVAASAAVTARAQAAEGAVANLAMFSPAVRLGNAAVSYVAYLAMTVWPVNLAIYYPHPIYNYDGSEVLPASEVGGALLLLAALTAGAVALRRRAPYLLAGWLWFLGTLVPVIGLVQVGGQAYADRYTYFPQIGLLLAACWGAADLAPRALPRVAWAAGAVVAVVLAALTWDQLQVWRDSVALWEHDIKVARDCPTAQMNLGEMYMDRGRYEEAARCFGRAIQLDPKPPKPHSNLGNALLKLGRLDDAEREQRMALAIDPNVAEVFFNLGLVQVARDRPSEAARYFNEALRLQPESAEALSSLGLILLQQGRLAEAEGLLRKAVRYDPNYGPAHHFLGKVLEAKRDFPGAAEQFEEATRLSPRDAKAWYNLGNARMRQQRYAEAAECFKRAVALDPEEQGFRKALRDAEALRRNGGPAPAAAPTRH
jgi:Tfp pilus assembly protein PilF